MKKLFFMADCFETRGGRGLRSFMAAVFGVTAVAGGAVAMRLAGRLLRMIDAAKKRQILTRLRRNFMSY